MDAAAHHRPQLALILRLCAVFTLSAMWVLAKLAGESGIHIAEILFWRQLPTAPFLLVWFVALGKLEKLKTRRLGTHGIRAALGLVGMFLNFGAVLLLPLAEASTFSFTSAIWAVLLSAVLLKEPIGIWRWSAVLLGFVGIIVIAQPGDGHIPPLGAAVALTAAFVVALISINIRDLARTDDPLVIVFYFGVITTPILALTLPFVSTPKSAYQWGILAGLSLVGFIGQFLLTAALRYGAVASVIVMDYSGLIWATVFGWIIFDWLPPSTTWIGAPLIIGAGILIAWREHRLAVERAQSAAAV